MSYATAEERKNSIVVVVNEKEKAALLEKIRADRARLQREAHMRAHPEERTGIDWQDPADVAYLTSNAGLSDRTLMLRNAERSANARKAAEAREREQYERKCRQDEARIARYIVHADFFDPHATMEWMGSGIVHERPGPAPDGASLRLIRHGLKRSNNYNG